MKPGIRPPFDRSFFNFPSPSSSYIFYYPRQSPPKSTILFSNQTATRKQSLAILLFVRRFLHFSSPLLRWNASIEFKYWSRWYPLKQKALFDWSTTLAGHPRAVLREGSSPHLFLLTVYFSQVLSSVLLEPPKAITRVESPLSERANRICLIGLKM